ncbi:hypothetical protein IJ384_00490 [bacterium]|nr:hypothetical protein [bacterium]
MITVLIPADSEFEKYKAQIKEIYVKCQEKICDSNSFEFIIKNTLFYSFFLDGVFIGAIYYFKENDKLFLNAFALPKNHQANLECLQLSTTWFKKPIYAEAQNRASALCLLRCGFKRVEGKLFCYE